MYITMRRADNTKQLGTYTRGIVVANVAHMRRLRSLKTAIMRCVAAFRVTPLGLVRTGGSRDATLFVFSFFFFFSVMAERTRTTTVSVGGCKAFHTAVLCKLFRFAIICTLFSSRRDRTRQARPRYAPTRFLLW